MNDDNTLATIQIEGDRYNETVSVVEYRGTIQLLAGNESKDGKNWYQWAFPRRGDKTPADKAIPVKVQLGEPKEAIRILKAALKVVEAHAAGRGQYGTPPVKNHDDVPF